VTIAKTARDYFFVVSVEDVSFLTVVLLVSPPQPMAEMAIKHATRDSAINFFTRTILSVLNAKQRCLDSQLVQV
jgi:hypothetical protein